MANRNHERDDALVEIASEYLNCDLMERPALGVLASPGAILDALEAAYEAGQISREPQLRAVRRELVEVCQALRDTRAH